MKFYKTSMYLLLAFTLSISACNVGGDDDSPIDGPGANLNLGIVGESAHDLLSDETYTKLQIEFIYAAGYEPPSQSINYLKNFLSNLLNKPQGINISVREVAAQGKEAYSISDLKSLEATNRTFYTEGSTIKAYFYFADGNYSENENVLGIAYRNTSMVLFQKRIEELSGGLGQASTELLTSSVLAHEFGHILGLVNTGTEPQSDHQDEPNGHHCDVTDCLMYYAVDSSAGLDDLVGLSSPPDLDAQCKADLKANGGK